MDSSLTVNAVDNAINLLGTHLIAHSFSVKGCLYDNACIESFHASIGYITPQQCEDNCKKSA